MRRFTRGRYRVIQWATGHQGRHVIDMVASPRRPHLELVGCWVSSKEKVGLDAGEIAGVGVLEGEHVAASFERLQQRLPGLVEPLDYKTYVGARVTVEQFRALLRDGRYDIVHFAGHGRYDADHQERSCWLFSDGPLYAFELRHTLANAHVTPWLIYGSACEGGRDGSGGYHDGVYGIASAALGQGVAAYVGPLWKITETDAKNLAAAFYDALLLRRTSVGEALALARRSVKQGEPDLDELRAAMDDRSAAESYQGPIRSAGWTGMILYGDPTPTVLQRLSPSASASKSERGPGAGARSAANQAMTSVLNRTAGSPSTT